jgi:FkbM family methyltransferase
MGLLEYCQQWRRKYLPSLRGKTAPRKFIYTLVPGEAPIELVDYYSEFIGYYPECELQTKRWFVENIEKEWVIFDVGANIGYYSILFSRLASMGRVFAFEPTQTIAKLNANIDHHGCRNVTAFKTALGARAGKIEENIYRIWGRPPERMIYEFSTIDDMVKKLGLTRLDCIKIDVDSFDYEVLRGGQATLAKFDPWVIVELNHALAKRSESVPQALEWLSAQGYTSAFVVDYENYILRRQAQRPASGRAQIELTFDTRPTFLIAAQAKSVERANPLMPAPNWCRDAHSNHEDDFLSISVPGPRWSYAATWKRKDAKRRDAGVTDEAVVFEIEVAVHGGEVGFLFVKSDWSTVVGKETYVKPSAFRQTISVFKPAGGDFEYLVLRNTEQFGEPANVNIFAIRCYLLVPAKPKKLSDVLLPRTKSISRANLLKLVGEDDIVENDISALSIDIVPIGDLGVALGFSRPFVSTRVYRHPLAEFNTERDETHIFEYIYENFAPHRHLEFGTWEGHGAATVARVCKAEIWTINLPEGECNSAGDFVYGGSALAGGTLPGEFPPPPGDGPTDSGEWIGWRYRAAGFGHRIHQILCNSLDLDTSQWSQGFFDTVFIDGGHSEDVVCSDTDKAYQLLRPGGLMIWHDFCPEPETLALNEAPRGVAKAIAANMDRWLPGFQRLFWIRPTWILLGIRSNHDH